MAEDRKNDPQFKPGNLEPFKSAKVVIKSAKPIATGNGKFGDWNLWLIEVENQKVFDKGAKQPREENYTGTATIFPSEKLHEKFMEITNGTKVDAEIEIKLVPQKNMKGGYYTTYEVNVVKEGATPSNNIPFFQTKYITDFNKFAKNDILQETMEEFIKLGQEDPYNINEEALKKLWNVYVEKYM